MCIRDRYQRRVRDMIRSLLTFALIALLMAPQFVTAKDHHDAMVGAAGSETPQSDSHTCAEMDTDCGQADTCLLYTSDAADDLLCVDLGGRRIIKKKKNNKNMNEKNNKK
eukprot:TRINITY_DN2340_c0_g1_i1.p1 TRINITY_DN2340_c0_g1~~TRINITY_DN2340_c0_g1_i1.p1  ORF type:complete len:110 (+),score=48.90 TRINITY_DN2340_c0_g1_i1:123-452(+)